MDISHQATDPLEGRVMTRLTLPLTKYTLPLSVGLDGHEKRLVRVRIIISW